MCYGNSQNQVPQKVTFTTSSARHAKKEVPCQHLYSCKEMTKWLVRIPRQQWYKGRQDYSLDMDEEREPDTLLRGDANDNRSDYKWRIQDKKINQMKEIQRRETKRRRCLPLMKAGRTLENTSQLGRRPWRRRTTMNRNFHRVNIGKFLETSRRRVDKWTSTVAKVYLIGWDSFKGMRCLGFPILYTDHVKFYSAF